MEIVAQSYKFFQNKKCTYFSCHGIDTINCVFCFCPLYHLDCTQYGGTPRYLQGSHKKDCSACILPHKPENYNMLIELLK
jgi:Zn-finger protein